MSCGIDGEFCMVDREGPHWNALEEVAADKVLTRLVRRGLSNCIAAHGPITRALIESAVKRVVLNIQNSIAEREKALRESMT